MKKKDILTKNEMDLKFSKIVIFTKQYKILNPKMLFDGLDFYLRYTFNSVPCQINWF